MLRSFLIGALVLLAACGGETGPDTDPDPPLYPAVAGNYTLSGTIDGMTNAEGSMTGTFSLQQPSRSEPGLTGTSRLTVTIGGTGTTYDFPLSSATVTEGGTIRYDLVDDFGDPWSFSGTFSVGKVTGTHVLKIGGATEFTGTFVATRPGG